MLWNEEIKRCLCSVARGAYSMPFKVTGDLGSFRFRVFVILIGGGKLSVLYV